MSESTTTILIQRRLDRVRAGDAAARNELLEYAADRLRRLTQKMLRSDPGVRRWEETGDVCQNATLRLWRSLESVQPETVRDFFRFAAVQVRRELIDLARHHYGPHGDAAHHHSHGPAAGDQSQPPAHEQAADVTGEPTRLLAWSEFHEQVEKMPDEQREVFDLVWYQGLKQEEAAEMLGVTVRTIKYRWRSARLWLHDALGGELPDA